METWTPTTVSVNVSDVTVVLLQSPLGHSDHSSVSYPHMRDSGYETTSSNIDHLQQCRFLSSTSSPSNISLSTDGQVMTVSYLSSPTPCQSDEASCVSSTNLSRTLKTFAHLSRLEAADSQSSRMARLAEQETIEV